MFSFRFARTSATLTVINGVRRWFVRCVLALVLPRSDPASGSTRAFRLALTRRPFEAVRKQREAVDQGARHGCRSVAPTPLAPSFPRIGLRRARSFELVRRLRAKQEASLGA